MRTRRIVGIYGILLGLCLQLSLTVNHVRLMGRSHCGCTISPFQNVSGSFPSSGNVCRRASSFELLFVTVSGSSTILPRLELGGRRMSYIQSTQPCSRISRTVLGNYLCSLWWCTCSCSSSSGRIIPIQQVLMSAESAEGKIEPVRIEEPPIISQAA